MIALAFDLLRRSAWLVWQHRVLWWLGLLAVVGEIMGMADRFGLGAGTGETVDLASCVWVLGVIAGFIVLLIAGNALTVAAAETNRGIAPSVRQALAAGRTQFWPVFVLFLFYGTVLVLVDMLLGLLLPGARELVRVIGELLSSVFFVIIGLAQAAVVLGRESPSPAVATAMRLIRKAPLTILVLSVITGTVLWLTDHLVTWIPVPSDTGALIGVAAALWLGGVLVAALPQAWQYATWAVAYQALVAQPAMPPPPTSEATLEQPFG